MTRWRTLIPLLGPMLAAGAIDRLPAHLEPLGSGFVARTGQRTYLLTETGALRFSPRAVMTFVGANPGVHAEPIRRLPGKTNYLHGSDPARWRTGVPQFGGVRYASLYPGVDLIYHADTGLEYDLAIAPRVSPRRVVMEFSGADSVRVSRDGGLLVHAGDGELKFERPRISQDGRDVRGGFRIVGTQRAAFWIDDYDHTRPLLIDPVVGAFGTLGTPILAVAADTAGNVYVAGNATGTVPVVNALQPHVGTGNCSPETNVLEACQDVYLAKLDPTATQILYCTYLGDNGFDWFGGLAVDAQGNAYFAATGYPAQAFFGHQPSGTGHAFVRKLSPDGSALLYDKSLGANTQAGAVTLDVSGNAYLTGTSFSASFPAVHALQPQPVVTPIFVTRDGGASWNPVHAPAPTVNMLAIAPGSSTTFYAAASVGLLKSIDGGASWTNLIPTAIAATVVVLDPKTPSTVYTVYSAAASGSLPSQSVLARSLDAGATWSILSGIPLGFLNYPAPVTGLAVDPENSSALWIAAPNTVGGMIDKSVDAGASWLTAYSPAVKPPPFPIGPTTVAVNPTDSAHVYTCCVGQPGAVEGSSLLSTKDGGATWTAGGGAPVHSFALDPSNPLMLYAAASTGLDKSSDSGVSWSTVNLPPPGYSSNVLVSATGVVYGANDDGAFFRSTDHGSTWSVTKGPFGSGATVLAIDPAAPATVYVGSPQSQIQDAFAAKLDSTGNTVWATLLGGSGSDSGLSIAVDVKGNVYLAGTTNSSDFPVLNAVQSTLGQVLANTVDAFVAEISADGSALVYSTYLGTEVENAVVAVDAGGAAFVAGITGTSSFPLVNPMFSASGTTYTEFGYGGGFVAKIAAGGGKLTFSTYFPANPVALSVDSAGEPWLAGQYGVQLPMVQPIQPSAGNGFLAHLNSSGSTLLFSTFLCGSVSSLSLAPGGSVWVAGGACYNDFPNIGSAATNGPVGYVARIDAAPPTARAGIPRIDGVYNAGGYQWGNAVAPGEVVTLLGAELASSTVSAAGGRLPTSLSDVTVTVGGISAPLYYVSPGQINFQAPTNLTLGAADLVVTRSTAITHRAVNVVAMQTGIFFVNGVPAVTHASDFSLVTASNPAHPGEYLTVFCSGLGLTTPVVPAGQVSPFAPIVAPGYVSIGTGAEVLFQYAGLSPDSIGLYQINFQLPANSVVGLTDLFLSISYQSTTDVPLYVK